ncbi:rap/ran GTPase-activating protein [Pelomyxa schiedti]|nr:rap/ran GTPase-activating protein [Pelomyxa schiedti]
MFLEWVAQVTGLLHSPDTNILNTVFPISVQRTIVSNVVTYFMGSEQNGINISLLLPTQAHVFWVMECIGQGFRLPLIDHNLITQCIDLYTKWIQSPPERQPAWIRSNLDAYYVLCLKHLSLLFSNRTKVREDIQTHVTLSLRALNTFSIVTKLKLHPETWEVMLKLLLGMTDSLLCTNNFEEESCGDLIADRLLQVLYDAWLTSGNTNVDLWNSFFKLHKNWSTHLAVITQWAAACSALTRSVLARLYTPNPPTVVHIWVSATITSVIDINDDYVFYVWQRFLHLLGNVVYIPSPNNYRVAMSGICICIEDFLQIIQNCTPGAPDGNTILNIFAGPLFEAVIKNRPGYEEGTSFAIEGLCKIFFNCKRSIFAPKYLAGFIRAAKAALATGDAKNMTLISLLLHSQNLIPTEITGFKILIPYYVHAISRILKQNPSTFRCGMPVETVRRACLNILCHIMCYACKYQKTPFPADSSLEGDSVVETFYDLEHHIGLMLLTALDNEISSSNLKCLLSQSLAFILEFLPTSESTKFSIVAPQAGPQVAPLFVWSLLHLILKNLGASKWPSDVSCCALSTLCEIVVKYQYIERADQYAQQLVSQLSQLVRSLLDDPSSSEHVVAESYRCIATWAMVNDSKWLFANLRTLSSMVEVAVLGIPSLNKAAPKKKESPMITDAAISTLLCCGNQLGAFPSPAGSERMSAHVTEEMLLSRICETSNIPLEESNQLVRYFMMDDNIIISLIDIPSLSSDGVLVSTMITRDRTAKYVWQGHISYATTNAASSGYKKQPDLPEKLVPRTSEWKQKSLSATSEQYQQLTSFLERLDCKEEAVPEIPEIISRDQAELEAKSYGLLGKTWAEPPPTFEVTQQSQFRAGRVLAAHLGFVQSQHVVVPLDNSPALIKSIKQLDQQPERECMAIGVVYAKTGQFMEEDIYANVRLPEDYQKFVSSLGWDIQVATHNGFLGDLDRRALTGATAPYYANFSTEVIFHVSSKMPNHQQNQHKKRLIGKDYVLIVWSEDGNYDPCCLESVFHDVKIVISPLPSGLYRVSTIVNPKIVIPGPFVEDVTVSHFSLGPLVRSLSITAHRAAQTLYDGASAKPYFLRQRILCNITKAYKKADLPRNVHFSSFFHQIPTGSKTRESLSPVPATRKPHPLSSSTNSLPIIPAASSTTTSTPLIGSPPSPLSSQLHHSSSFTPGSSGITSAPSFTTSPHDPHPITSHNTVFIPLTPPAPTTAAPLPPMSPAPTPPTSTAPAPPTTTAPSPPSSSSSSTSASSSATTHSFTRGVPTPTFPAIPSTSPPPTAQNQNSASLSNNSTTTGTNTAASSFGRIRSVTPGQIPPQSSNNNNRMSTSAWTFHRSPNSKRT